MKKNKTIVKQNRIVMSMETNTIKKLKKLAKMDGRTVSDFVHQIIKSYLKFKRKNKKT